MEISWSAEKNVLLKQEGGLEFELLAESIQAGNVMEVALNPNHPKQVIFMLMTAYKGRKLNSRFNGGA